MVFMGFVLFPLLLRGVKTKAWAFNREIREPREKGNRKGGKA
jgi:hypothetical protein